MAAGADASSADAGANAVVETGANGADAIVDAVADAIGVGSVCEPSAATAVRSVCTDFVSVSSTTGENYDTRVGADHRDQRNERSD